MELRGDGVTDTRVLSAIERVPREQFVPPSFLDRAYENTALPIGYGQTISQPSVVAMMTEALDPGPRMRVLEIGTGCGYQTAVLAQLCRRVYSVERHRALLREAEARFRALRIGNIVTRFGDGAAGWPEIAPFPRIIVTAAAASVPPALAGQLAPDGILVMPIGANGGVQHVVRFRSRDGTLDAETLWPVRFVPLVAATEDQ